MVGAFFDMDGTLVRSTVVHYYFFFARLWYRGWRRVTLYATMPLRIIIYLIVDMISRSAFNRLMYRSYRGMEKKWLEEKAMACLDEFMKPRFISVTCNALRRHKEAGHVVVLVTGSLDFIVEPLARAMGIDYVLCPRLEFKEGRATGRLLDKPVVDRRKGDLMKEFAAKNGIDLDQSYAYADSMSDLAMFESVAHPIAVMPEKRLAKYARANDWTIWR